MTLFESSSEADTEELSSELLYQDNSTLTSSSADTYKHEHHNLTQQAQNEIPARIVHQLGCMEETKQHSPVSVLEELLFDKVPLQFNPVQEQVKRRSNQMSFVMSNQLLPMNPYFQLPYGNHLYIH